MFDEFDNQEAEVQLEAKIEEKKEQEIQPEDEKAGLQLQEESLKPAHSFWAFATLEFHS